MFKNRIFRHAVRVCMASLLAVSLAAVCQAAPKKITLKAITAWPKTVYESQNFLKFVEMVNENAAKKYPGELEIQYAGGPEVIPNREQVEALRNGLVDMVFTTDGYYVSAVPEVNAMSLTKLKPWEEREKGVNAYLDKIHQEKVNAVYLGRLGNALPFMLYLTKPIKSVADLKGMKIRCSPTHIDFLKKLGAQPLVIPPPDVYTALERGLVDGYIWVAGLIDDWGWQEVTKYVVNAPFYTAANLVLVNKKKWDGMPEHLQKLITETEEQAEHYVVGRADALMKQKFEAYKKLGIKFIDLSPAENAKFVDAAYSALWDVVLAKAPENGAKLKQLLGQ
jgi:TRAP-type C4-dicarboxylate transport system substrate-binding protein